MKVYQIITEPYQDFCFYNRSGLLTLTCDPKYPYIGGNSLYDGETKNWIQVPNPMFTFSKMNNPILICDGNQISARCFSPDRVTCPHWFVSKKYYNEHVKEQLIPLIEAGFKAYDKNTFNAFVFKKPIKNNRELIAIGMCVRDNIKGSRCHSEFTNFIQRHISLKAFW